MSNATRRRLGNSAVLHGVVGGVLALPMFLLSLIIFGIASAGLHGSSSSASGSGGPGTPAWQSTAVNLLSQVEFSIWASLFWIIVTLVPALAGLVLYLVRCWLACVKADGRGYVAYGAIGAMSAFLTLALTFLVAPLANVFYKSGITLSAMFVTLPVSGIFIGIAALRIDTWLHKSR